MLIEYVLGTLYKIIVKPGVLAIILDWLL